jgi:thioredoxin reductase (NADPH)
MSNTPERYREQAFPVLTDDQIELLRPFSTERATAAGEVLFEIGDLEYPMVVVLSGRVRIVDRSFGMGRSLKESGPGEFVGELGLLTGQTVFIACEVTEPGSVLCIPPRKVRKLIRTVPEIADLIVTAFAARRELLMETAAATLKLFGPRDSGPALALREFLDRNRIPHRWLDRDDPQVAEWAKDRPRSDATIWAIVRGNEILDDPTSQDLARAMGLELAFHQDHPADLLVVGTGPAGMSTAVYGASEGLETLAIDDVAIGGQAGTSSRIENYLGFPNGISGGALAFKAQVQAIKFGAQITVPRCAKRLERDGDGFVLSLDDGKKLRGRSVVIATGARYRRLDLPRQEDFDGAGIYYAATDLEARLCEGQAVVVVGGGNSAGQAAMFLARSAACVYLLYRGDQLGASMSQYLLSRLEYSPSVEIRTGTQVRELRGDGRLDGIVVESRERGREEIPTGAMFVMIGADPCTDWLQGMVDLDGKGFVLTGQPVAPGEPIRSPFETSVPGLFAVGDVRSGSVKRVASAVGEGSVVVAAVHQYLAAATSPLAPAEVLAPVGR